MARRHKRRQPNDLPLLFTFADLTTVLLSFFVLMLALRHPEVQKYQAGFAAFAGAAPQEQVSPQPGPGQGLGGLGGQLPAMPPEESQTPAQQTAQDLELPGGGQDALPESLQAGVNLRSEERGTVVTLANDVLFGPGSAWISPQAAAEIHKAALVLKASPLPLSVEGHTDDQPPAGQAYKDNWELSLARALAVARQLIRVEGLEAARVRVAALAGTRPLAPDDSDAHRAMNRRTELVLLTNGG